jgi:type VI secretion system protein ImpF
MAGLEREPTVVASILDRLLDHDPDPASREPIPDRLQNIQELKASVARDLEALLNTRQECLDVIPPDFPEAGVSLLTYGLPDCSSYNLHSQRDRQKVHRAIESAITKFEPRLADVRVSLEPMKEYDPSLRFRVGALLKMDPAPTPVTFDTVLRLNTQQYVVEGKSDG